MNYKKNIAKAAILFFIFFGISKILGYFFILILSRLGKEIYGYYNISFSIASSLAILALFGLNQGILRYVPYYNQLNNKIESKRIFTTAFIISFPLSLIFSALIFLYPNHIAGFFPNINNSLFVNSIKYFAFLIPLIVISRLFEGFLKANGRFKASIVFSNFLNYLLRLILAIILIRLGFGLFGAIYGTIISVLIISLLMALYTLKRYGNLFVKGINKKVIFYSFPLLLTFFVLNLNISLSTILIGFFLNASEAGLFNAAMPTALLLFVIPTAILYFFMPSVAQKHAKKQEIESEFHYVTKWITIFVLPISLFMVFFSNKIIIFLFGLEYMGSYNVLTILVIGVTIQVLFSACGSIIKLFEKTKQLLWISLFTFVVYVILSMLLIPLMGINGAAIAMSIFYILNSVLQIIFVKKISNIKVLPDKFSKILIASALSFFPFFAAKILLFSQFEYLFVYILITLAMGFTYIFILHKWNIFDRNDKEIFYLILNKMKLRN